MCCGSELRVADVQVESAVWVRRRRFCSCRVSVKSEWLLKMSTWEVALGWGVRSRLLPNLGGRFQDCVRFSLVSCR